MEVTIRIRHQAELETIRLVALALESRGHNVQLSDDGLLIQVDGLYLSVT